MRLHSVQGVGAKLDGRAYRDADRAVAKDEGSAAIVLPSGRGPPAPEIRRARSPLLPEDQTLRLPETIETSCRFSYAEAGRRWRRARGSCLLALVTALRPPQPTEQPSVVGDDPQGPDATVPMARKKASLSPGWPTEILSPSGAFTKVRTCMRSRRKISRYLDISLGSGGFPKMKFANDSSTVHPSSRKP